ncbi:helix-turn-helix domain-containing protein [Streptomyces abikoensis]|uniref:ArsR/SmtB family transcription factor n=1 Tax=Streptomyces abikoensis TaxID=97398 RepID=UPI0033C59570
MAEPFRPTTPPGRGERRAVLRVHFTPGPDPLTPLLGRTRAGVLRRLVQRHSTTTLADGLGISVASASMHAKALREAGLVVTRREGKTARHQCSGLGLDLLGDRPAIV